MSKRGASPPPEGVLIKRARSSEPPATTQLVISSSNDERQQALIRTVKRTSNLEAPIISLSGAHSVILFATNLIPLLSLIFCGTQAEIFSCRFDPTGQNIAACSADRSVCMSPTCSPLRLMSLADVSLALWRTYPPNTNHALLSSLHKAPITDLQWSLFSSIIYTVSADNTMIFTDGATGERTRKIRAHRGIINSLDRTMSGGAGMELVATGSDDGTVKIWEGGHDGSKQSVATFEIGCPVTSVCWSADGANVYVGALDNEIHVCSCHHPRSLFSCVCQVYDLRKQSQVYSLSGHTDTPTSIALSPNGSFILSPSLSSQTIIHDVRPFSPSPSRVHRVLMGAPAGFESTLLKGAWSKDDGGKRVAVGGADRTVCIWDVESARVLYKVRLFHFWVSYLAR
jgi:Prp8 binding protein